MADVPYSVYNQPPTDITTITGLDWNNIDNNELIKKKDGGEAEGAKLASVALSNANQLTFQESNGNAISSIVCERSVIDDSRGLYIYPFSSGETSSTPITAFQSNDTSTIRLGVNTFTPSSVLDVNGDARVSTSLKINTTATAGTNDAIMFSHGRIQSKGGSGTNMFLESYGGYLVLKSGDKVAIDAANAIYYTTPTSASSMGHYFTGVVFHFNGSNWASDDRLKWEEVPIANGLSVINRLQPQVYWKGNSLDVEPTPTERRRESGFIAQEVEQIPELAHAVIQSVQDDVSNGTYFLDYAQLHAYHVAATQELHTLVGQQRALIETLTSRVAALET